MQFRRIDNTLVFFVCFFNGTVVKEVATRTKDRGFESQKLKVCVVIGHFYIIRDKVLLAVAKRLRRRFLFKRIFKH
jgi:hypothetical protein